MARGASVSDLHLGFTAYPATIGGRNAREVDVERAWAQAVDTIVSVRPELVTVAGDVFHTPRVGAYAVKAWRDGIRRIVLETDARVIVIPGNHDVPRTAAALTPVVIPDDLPRVHIVTRAERVAFRTNAGELVAVACFPFVALDQVREYSLEPDPDADVNALLVHAAVKSSAEGADEVPRFYVGRDALDVGTLAELYDVVIAGDFHEFRRLHPGRPVFYSGSLERTSSNIWQEEAPKGVVLWETEDDSCELIPIPTRRVADFEVFPDDSLALEPGQIDARLRRIAADPNLEGAIVRLCATLPTRADKLGIDPALVRAAKAHCLHFQLDIDYAAAAGAGEDAAGNREARGGRTLLDEAAEYFAGEPTEVRDVCIRYLSEAA